MDGILIPWIYTPGLQTDFWEGTEPLQGSGVTGVFTFYLPVLYHLPYAPWYHSSFRSDSHLL